MSDPEPTVTLGSVLSVVFGSIAVVVRAIFNIQWSWYFSWLVHILALPWKIVLIPLSFIARVLLVVFAPALYIVAYVFSWVRAVFAFLALLEVGELARFEMNPLTAYDAALVYFCKKIMLFFNR